MRIPFWGLHCTPWGHQLEMDSATCGKDALGVEASLLDTSLSDWPLTHVLWSHNESNDPVGYLVFVVRCMLVCSKGQVSATTTTTTTLCASIVHFDV